MRVPYGGLWGLLVLLGCGPGGVGPTERSGSDERPPGDRVAPDGGEDRMLARDAGEARDAAPEVDPGDAGGAGNGDGDALGECTGTENECLAARLINEYRARHVQEGECSDPLRWDPHLGRLAHEHQSGPFVRHSSHGYIENVGNEFSIEGAVEWILEYTPGVEEHCRRDGTYVASHHCAGMFCNNRTVGVGVYEDGSRVYMTMMFGDAEGRPSW